VLVVFPVHLRSFNGSVFSHQQILTWLSELGAKTLFIELGSPWENGSIESLNDMLRDEPWNREIFYTLQEANVISEQWRTEYNTVRPHRALGYRPPAPEAVWMPQLAPPLMAAVVPTTT
jgi:putative transposase